MNSHAAFPPTRWSLVSDLKRQPSSRQSVLAELCQLYWQPVYAFLRRRGMSPADAQDATQGFFLGLLETDGFDRADRDAGRLRTFLLGALKRWQRGEWRKATAQKRGGGVAALSMDFLAEESGVEIVDAAPTPEEAFDRRYALATLETALQRLADEQRAAGRERAFALMRPLLTPGADADSGGAARAAEELGLTAEAFRVALHRLRKRFGQVLRQTVADTLADPQNAAVDEEMATLRRALQG